MKQTAQNHYEVDFTVTSRESGIDYQSSANIIADNHSMANHIFYDAVDQMFPESEFVLGEVGSVTKGSKE